MFGYNESFIYLKAGWKITWADGGHSGCWWDERCGVNHSTLCLVGWTQLKYLPLVGTCHHAPTGGSRALSHLSVCICREFPRGAILVLIPWWSIVEGFFPVNPAAMGRQWWRREFPEPTATGASIRMRFDGLVGRRAKGLCLRMTSHTCLPNCW